VHRGDPAVLPVRPRVRRDEERAGERDQLDRDRDDHNRAECLRCAPEEHERREVRREGEGEQREEERAERAAVRAASICRDERGGLDPRTGDAAGNEQRDRTRREQGGARQGSSGPVVGGGSVVGGGGVVGGGVVGCGFGAGFGFGGGCEAGGASGSESVGSVAVVSVVVAGGV
jgi:hypothetical protein